MTSSLLLERIPKKIKLWENSKALTLYNNYTITANTVDIYYEKDVSHMSTIQIFGHTRTLSSSLPVYFGPDIKIEFEIKQGSVGLTSGVGNEFWPHPTQHILVTNDHGGFVTEPMINFGFDRIRYRVHNNANEDIKVSLILRYT
tara:strand:- start:590 stop:1021 length:432 start_codon:yes stop_codon:yes gene_type:complete